VKLDTEEFYKNVSRNFTYSILTYLLHGAEPFLRS